MLLLLSKALSELKHYVGIAALLLLVYFLFGPMIYHWEDNIHSVSTPVAVIQTTPAPGLPTVVGGVAEAAKNTALTAAVENQAIQLSAAQQTIATLVEKYGANAKFASGVAGAVASTPPQRQVIEVSVPTPDVKFSPTEQAGDSQIVKDVKTALKETPLDVHQTTTVNVKWEDKPRSRFFATYTADGSSGMGYTVRKAPWLNLDALVVQKVDAGTKVGVGLDHPLKGTAGRIGLAALVDPHTGRVVPEGFVGIDW